MRKTGHKDKVDKQTYIQECIQRALDNPRLSKVDVSEIFEIPLEQIIKISRSHQINQSVANQMIVEELADKNQLAKQHKLDNPHKLVGKPQLSAQVSKIPKFPPYKLTPKLKAIIQILKSKPQILQRQMIQILQQKYSIYNMTQTTISRYVKQIYLMKAYVDRLGSTC